MGVSKKVTFQSCQCCGNSLGVTSFIPTKNPFYVTGYLPICDNCLNDIAAKAFAQAEANQTNEWAIADKFCQMIDVPFVPDRWEKLYQQLGSRSLASYARIFLSSEYERFGWGEQQQIYKQLEEEGTLVNEVVPKYTEKQIEQLKQKWGPNYDNEELIYLEQLYNGILNTQSVNGALQTDQALKLCKLSLVIDSRIREGQEIDKPLASYEKLVKVAEFTPKNIKNAQDFDSVGELFAYLEKVGFQNKFYDGVQRDIVDVTMNNIQNFCQRLYTQESGIGDDIDKRIQSLNRAREIEDGMGLDSDYTSDDTTQEVNDYCDQGEFSPEV